MKPFSLNIRGRLQTYSRPVVMGILNVTPDSFFAESRMFDEKKIAERTEQLVAEGADIIDVGGCSTRPGACFVGEQEEIDRIGRGLKIVREIAPEAVVSIDTFRSKVATVAVNEMGCDIVNDISGGNYDSEMFDTIARLNVPYVLTHNGQGADAGVETNKTNDVTANTLSVLGEKIKALMLKGVKDVIVDPGIGFGKTVDENYDLLRNLRLFEVLHKPILIGVSRKSLITRLLNLSAEDSLVGTAALHAMCLERGASILRVHDVKAAKECIKIYQKFES